MQMMQPASFHLAHHYSHCWYADVSFASVLVLLLRLMVEFMLAIDTHFQGVMVGLVVGKSGSKLQFEPELLRTGPEVRFKVQKIC